MIRSFLRLLLALEVPLNNERCTLYSPGRARGRITLEDNLGHGCSMLEFIRGL